VISVIVATYNREELLCDTLQYLFAQKDVDFEILVIDQSRYHKEATRSFLENNSKKIRYYSLDNANLPAARNFGVDKSKGEIIVFIDDDVVFDPYLISNVAKIFQSNPELSGLTGLSWSGNMYESTKWNVLERRYRVKAQLIKDGTLWPTLFLPGFFMSFRKEVLLRCGGFDEWIGEQRSAANEDGEMSLRIRLMGGKLRISTQIQILHLVSLSGGCEVRHNYDQEKDEIRYHQFKMSLYGTIKNRKMFSRYQYYIQLVKYVKNYFSLYEFKINNIVLVTSKTFQAIKEVKLYLARKQ
jgi:GT2 family glycosyltransferase